VTSSLPSCSSSHCPVQFWKHYGSSQCRFVLHKSLAVGLRNLASSITPVQQSKQYDSTLTVNMSFIPNIERQRTRHPSQPMTLQNQDRMVSAQNYPMHGTPAVDSTMGLPNTWLPHNGAFPSMAPGIGQSSYMGNARDMGVVPSSFPNPGPAMLPSTYNHQAIRSPYVTSCEEPWSNAYDTVVPMSGHQPAWEQSNMGFSNYQQPSPSRSDGSASTQVSGLSSPYNHPSPLIKLENPPDLSPYSTRYAFEATNHQQPKFIGTGATPIISPQSHRPIGTSLVSYGHPTEDIKYDFDAYNLESLSLSSDPRISNPGARSKRGHTSPEEAVCSCEICGKPFKRANNLKTHMETHAPDRSHPHRCEYDDCTRAFVRKTDLVRHEQSVSLSPHTMSVGFC
jgi:hypothetical protein